MISHVFSVITVTALAVTTVHVYADETATWSIGAAKVRSGIPMGTQMGRDHTGVLNIPGERYSAGGSISKEAEDSYRRVINEELKNANYSSSKENGNSVFEDEIEQEIPNFLIGATITNIKFNTYSRSFIVGGDFTKSEVKVKWEVLNRETNKVIYSKETNGDAKVSGHTSDAIYEAFRKSFKDFLEGPEFKTVMNQGFKESEQPITTYNIPAIEGASSTIDSKKLIGLTVPSVVNLRTSESRGTGFFISSDGLIVTNNHVVEDAFSATAELYDSSTKIAKVIRKDKTTDVALLKVDTADVAVKALPVCYRDVVKTGDDVLAVGNPGLPGKGEYFANTVTKGIVSGLRVINNRNLIQTDVAVNPGNSGGPLLNNDGVVIGIVTEKIVLRGVDSLGFALPIGMSLQKLRVTVNTPQGATLDECGNPVLSNSKNSNIKIQTKN